MTRKNKPPKINTRTQVMTEAKARYAELEEMRHHCLNLLLIPTQLAQALKNNELLQRVPDLKVVLDSARSISTLLPTLKDSLDVILRKADKVCASGAMGEDQMFKLMDIYSRLHDWTLNYANTIGNDIHVLTAILGPIEQEITAEAKK